MVYNCKKIIITLTQILSTTRLVQENDIVYYNNRFLFNVLCLIKRSPITETFLCLISLKIV